MILGRVYGSVFSTINHRFYDGRKLLLIDRVDADGRSTGKYLIAVDAVGAGAGETVLVIDEGNSARQVIGDNAAPIRSIVIGIIDHIHQNKAT